MTMLDVACLLCATALLLYGAIVIGMYLNGRFGPP